MSDPIAPSTLELTGQLTDELYDLALVLDDTPGRFHEAALVLHKLHRRYTGKELKAIDLLYSKPATVLCILYFDPRFVDDDFADVVAREARAGGFRFMNLTRLGLRERNHFYKDTVRRFSERLVAVGDLTAAIEQLRWRLDRERPPEVLVEDTWFSATVSCAGARFDALVWDVSQTGAYLECREVIPPGQAFDLELKTPAARFPLRCRAVYRLDSVTAAKRKRGAGFGAAFELTADEVDAFESFLIAATRNKEWPERSGRQFERFPIRLRVNYEYQGEQRREFTHNLSRRGLFIETFDPPAAGVELALRVFALGGEASAELRGKVVRSIDAAESAQTKMPCGAGIEFTESSSVAADKVRELLAYVPAERRRRAMLVDDDRFFRQVLSHSLGLAGYEVLQAGSGEEAFGLLVEELFHLDVLILDLYMPGMTGDELVKRLRGVGAKLGLAVVVLTGAQMTPGQEERLKEIGADAVIPKSDSPEVVVERIETISAAKRSTRRQPL